MILVNLVSHEKGNIPLTVCTRPVIQQKRKKPPDDQQPSVSSLQCVSGVSSIHRGDVFRAAARCTDTWLIIGGEPAADLTLTAETRRSKQHATTPPPQSEADGLCVRRRLFPSELETDEVNLSSACCSRNLVTEHYSATGRERNLNMKLEFIKYTSKINLISGRCFSFDMTAAVIV